MILSASICFLVNLLGCYFLFRRWKQTKIEKSAGLLLTGWTLLLLSSYLWCLNFAIEFGLTFGLITITICAWLFIFFDHQKTTPSTYWHAYQFRTYRFTQVIKSFGVFLTAGPLALTSSITWSLIIISWIPMARANQLVTTAFVFPIAWGVLSFWVCAQKHLRSSFSLLLISTVIASSILWLKY